MVPASSTFEIGPPAKPRRLGLAHDPGEATDLAGEHPPRVAAMRQQSVWWFADTAADEPRP